MNDRTKELCSKVIKLERAMRILANAVVPGCGKCPPGEYYSKNGNALCSKAHDKSEERVCAKCWRIWAKRSAADVSKK